MSRLAPRPVDPDALMDACLHHAARLVAAVRDRDRDEVAALLASAPGGRVDALAVAAASLVDPDRTLPDLLAWTRDRRPVDRAAHTIVASSAATGRRANPREHGTERGYKQHHYLREDACAPCLAAHTVHGRPQMCRDEFARLRAAGVDWARAAELSRLSVVLERHRARVNAANATAA